jgi:putative transposase
MKTTGINQIIVGDVTAFDIQGKDHFLALLMDLHNREIVGFAVSGKNDTNLVLSALEEANIRRGNLQGCIHHTDADVRYCSDKYIARLNTLGATVSMCVGNVYENAHAEALNGTIKREEINISDYSTMEESARSIYEYVKKYNQMRPHYALGDLSPIEFLSMQNKTNKIEKVSKI